MKLDDMAMEPAAYINVFDETLTNMERISGVNYTDQHRSLMLENTLPASWQNRLSAWKGTKSVLPYDKLRQLVGDVKKQSTGGKVLMAETNTVPLLPEMAPTTTTPQAHAVSTGLAVGSREWMKAQCYYCGKIGHSIHDCPAQMEDTKRGSRKTPEEFRVLRLAERHRQEMDKLKRTGQLPAPIWKESGRKARAKVHPKQWE